MHVRKPILSAGRHSLPGAFRFGISQLAGDIPSSFSNSTTTGSSCGSRCQLGPRYSDSPTTTVLRPIEFPPEIESLGYEPRLIACSWETSYIVLSYAGKSDILLSIGADNFGALGRVTPTEKGDDQTTGMHRVNFDQVLPINCVRFIVTSLSAGLYHVIAHLTATMDRYRML
jgi:protein ATS1